MQKLIAPLSMSVSKPRGLTNFLKARYDDGNATPLNAQESFRLSSFAQANCLICLEEDREGFKAGEMVDVYLLPGIN